MTRRSIPPFSGSSTLEIYEGDDLQMARFWYEGHSLDCPQALLRSVSDVGTRESAEICSLSSPGGKKVLA